MKTRLSIETGLPFDYEQFGKVGKWNARDNRNERHKARALLRSFGIA